MRKLKLLYVGHAFENAGGGEISLKTLANQMKEHGHEVAYASLRKYSDFKTYIFKKFHPIYTYELYEKYLSNFLRKVIRKENPDIIHANDRFAIIPTTIAAKKEGKPVVLHFRDFSLLSTTGLPYSLKHGHFDSFGIKEILKIAPIKRLAWELYKYFYIKRRYKIINKADVKIAISHSIKGWLDKQNIINSKIIRNPIYLNPPKKIPTRNKIRKELGIPEDATVLLFLGGFSIGKGVDIILKLIKKSSSLKGNVYFLLLGGGNEEKTIIELSKKNKKIIFPGKYPHDKIYGAYNVADIVLLPSKMEPFSRIVIEAMFMGKPVISSDTGGGKEAITNEVSGMLVDPDNVEAWIDAINKLITNKDLSKKFKSKYKDIIKMCSKEVTYNNFLKLYNGLLEKEN